MWCKKLVLPVLFYLAGSFAQGGAFQEDEIIVPASKMKFSRNVTAVEDHVVIWGLGKHRYAHISHPFSAIAFTKFAVSVEVAADTAANRWPNVAIALNDSSNLQIEKTVNSLDWQWLELGTYRTGGQDSLLYFVFTNDFHRKKKNQDLNLKIRRIKFISKEEDTINDQVKEVAFSELRFSNKVTLEDDHLAIWGMGKNKFAWAGYPLAEVPFDHFEIEAEVHGDSADGRWPILGVALHDSSQVQKQIAVRSNQWHQLHLGQYSKSQGNSLIYFLLLNDYFNPEKNHDINLYIKKVVFRAVQVDSKLVRVSWNPNTESFLGGYMVHFGTRSGHYTRHIDVGLKTELRIKLPVNSRYYFVVTAYESRYKAESLPSAEIVLNLESPASSIKSAKKAVGYSKKTERAVLQTEQPEFSVAQNYPNPFNLNTRIAYSLPQSYTVRMEVFNLRGQRVRTLLNDKPHAAGDFTVSWFGKNDDGQSMASGIYFYKLQASDFVQIRKMLLVQ